MNNPCEKCEDRRVGCHSECKSYTEWREQHEAARVKARAERAKEYAFDDYYAHRRERARKALGKKNIRKDYM